jgi:class 3 adenylate cyclase
MGIGATLVGPKERIALPSNAPFVANDGMPVKSLLRVVMHADVVGSTSLVQQDGLDAHVHVQSALRRFSDTIRAYGGSTEEIRGDALVALFERASDALSAAAFFQQSDSGTDDDREAERPILRVGLAIGEVAVADQTVTGAGVILAQRLEQLAEAGGIVVHASIRDSVSRRLPFQFSFLPNQRLKGFEEPVHAYRVTVVPGHVVPPPTEARGRGHDQQDEPPTFSGRIAYRIVEQMRRKGSTETPSEPALVNLVRHRINQGSPQSLRKAILELYGLNEESVWVEARNRLLVRAALELAVLASNADFQSMRPEFVPTERWNIVDPSAILNGKMPDVEHHYRSRLTQLKPLDIADYVQFVLLPSGLTSEAVDLLSEARKLDSVDRCLALNLARAQLCSGKAVEAEASVIESLELWPQSPLALGYRGLLSLLRGRRDEASLEGARIRDVLGPDADFGRAFEEAVEGRVPKPADAPKGGRAIRALFASASGEKAKGALLAAAAIAEREPQAALFLPELRLLLSPNAQLNKLLTSLNLGETWRLALNARYKKAWAPHA